MAVKKTAAQEAVAVAEGAGSGEEKPKKERKPRGQSLIWSDAMNAQLAAVLKGNEARVNTARSVTDVLKTKPEFEGISLSPATVASHVKSLIAQREADGRPNAPHMFLVTRPKPDLNLFD